MNIRPVGAELFHADST